MWKDYAIAKLRESNLKLTPQRLKLIEIINREGHKHPSINELHEHIKSEFPTFSISTLYSNLLILKELNLIEFFSHEGETRVETNVKPHMNLIHSGGVQDFVDERLIEEIEKKIERKIRFINIFVE